MIIAKVSNQLGKARPSHERAWQRATAGIDVQSPTDSLSKDLSSASPDEEGSQFGMILTLFHWRDADYLEFEARSIGEYQQLAKQLTLAAWAHDFAKNKRVFQSLINSVCGKVESRLSPTRYRHLRLSSPTVSNIMEWHAQLTKLDSQNWFRDAEQLLARLTDSDASSADRRKAVLFAEITAFTDEQRPRLLAALGEFITENRFSQDEKTITHVASAIRKYAMNMAEEHFEGYAEWFELTDTKSLACDIELELAQAVVSRILYEPFDTLQEIPRLGERLVGLANDYMTRRQILQKSYDAVVLNATMGAILLDAPGTRELIDAVKELELPWFEELLFRRLKRQATDLTEVQTELKRRLTQWLPQGE